MDKASYASLLAIFVMERESVRDLNDEIGFGRLLALINATAEEFSEQTAERDWTKGKGVNECLHDLAGELSRYYVNTTDDVILMMVRDCIK